MKPNLTYINIRTKDTYDRLTEFINTNRHHSGTVAYCGYDWETSNLLIFVESSGRLLEFHNVPSILYKRMRISEDPWYYYSKYIFTIYGHDHSNQGYYFGLT